MHAEPAEESEGLVRGILLILIVGIALGLVHNHIGRQSAPAWGVAWIGEDRVEALESMGAVSAVTPDPVGDIGDDADDVIFTSSSDPLAVPASAGVALPEIPDLGRPVPIELGAVKQFVDADGAFLIDARDAEEFAAGRIPGSINLPYDQAVTDPVLLESLDPEGRPIIVYCGGGTCEISISLAYELIAVGHGPIGVYMGGFPEWQESGYPTEKS